MKSELNNDQNRAIIEARFDLVNRSRDGAYVLRTDLLKTSSSGLYEALIAAVGEDRLAVKQKKKGEYLLEVQPEAIETVLGIKFGQTPPGTPPKDKPRNPSAFDDLGIRPTSSLTPGQIRTALEKKLAHVDDYVQEGGFNPRGAERYQAKAAAKQFADPAEVAKQNDEYLERFLRSRETIYYLMERKREEWAAKSRDRSEQSQPTSPETDAARSRILAENPEDQVLNPDDKAVQAVWRALVAGQVDPKRPGRFAGEISRSRDGNDRGKS